MRWDDEFTFRPFSQDSGVLAEVFFGNEYGMPRRFPEGRVVIDVGAHIGCFAVQALARGAAKLVCVEPDPGNFEILRRNVAPHDDPFGRVEIRQAACSVFRGELPFHSRGHLTASGGVTPFEANATVSSVTLDDLIAPHAEVELLKLDCEGAEWLLLQESELLPRCKRVVCELHPRLGRPDDPRIDPVTARLKALGFDASVTPRPAGCTNLMLWADRR